MVALPALHDLHQDLVRDGQMAPLRLKFEHGRDALQLGADPPAVGIIVEGLPQDAADHRSPGQAPPLPGRDAPLGRFRRLHLRNEILEPDELEAAPTEPKDVPGIQAAHEILLDMADEPPTPPFHGNHGVPHDGADGHPVAAGGPAVHDAVDPVFAFFYPVEFVIGRKGPPPGRDHGQHIPPLLLVHGGKRVGRQHALPQGLRPESIPDRQRAQELNEDVKRPDHGPAGLDFTRFHRLAEGRRLQELQPERGQEMNLALRTRLVSAPARALHEAGHPLRSADLDDGLDRPEIDPEIQRTGADHRLEPPVVQGVLDPEAQLLADAPVVQCNGPRQVGIGREDLLIPDFGLRPGVGEHQRTGVAPDDVHDLIEQLNPEVARPRQLLKSLRHEAVHGDALFDGRPDDPGVLQPVQTDQGLHRLVEVADGRGDAPDPHGRGQGLQLGNGQLDLHAPLVPQQVMPFIHHNGAQAPEPLLPPFLGQQHMQAFRRGDQDFRHAAVLFLLLGGGRVSGADLDRPAIVQVIEKARCRTVNLLRQRPDRRDPQHPQPSRLSAMDGGGNEATVGLSASRWGIDQSVAPGREMIPCLGLERKRSPPPILEEGGTGPGDVDMLWRTFHPAIIPRIPFVFLPFRT